MADERGGADDDRPAPHRKFGLGPNVWAETDAPPASWPGAEDSAPGAETGFGAGPNVWADGVDPADARPPRPPRRSGLAGLAPDVDPAPGTGPAPDADPASDADPAPSVSADPWADGAYPRSVDPDRRSDGARRGKGRSAGAPSRDLAGKAADAPKPSAAAPDAQTRAAQPPDAQSGSGTAGDSATKPGDSAPPGPTATTSDPTVAVRERLRAMLEGTSGSPASRSRHAAEPGADEPHPWAASGDPTPLAEDPTSDDPVTRRPFGRTTRRPRATASSTEWPPDAFGSGPDSPPPFDSTESDPPENARPGRRRRKPAAPEYGAATRSEFGGERSESRATGARAKGRPASGRAAEGRPTRDPDGRRGGQAPPPDPASAARDICLRLLSIRPRTRAELDKALRKREVDEDVISEVLERYADVGLIDDAAFAKAWVTSRHHSKGLAKRALAGELRRKGVADEETGAALEELDTDTEEATARDLVARRLRTERAAQRRPRRSTAGDEEHDGAARRKEQEALIRRLVGMLARKGYSPGLAFRIVKDALSEEIDNAETAELLDPDVFGSEEADFDQLRS
jgi:regulatory protein